MLKKITMMLLILSLLFCSCQSTEAASNGKIMEKLLKAYSNEKYEKAIEYGKKLDDTMTETCVEKMSSKMKKAYLKVVKSYPTDNSVREDGKTINGYIFSDIDNDKKADLLIHFGSCSADEEVIVYQYKKGKTVKTGQGGAVGHGSLMVYPNHKGIIYYETHMGGEAIYILKLKRGKIEQTLIGGRVVEDTDGDGLGDSYVFI